MDNSTSNPLFKHFRQPAIYFKLPSGGRYWPEGSLNLTVTGEIPIYPMTARDEITLRTPDALLNGQGVVDVIQSCCPNIINAWQMPSIDLDPIIIAIRIASYGNDMDIASVCPSCEHDNEHTMNLQYMTANMRMPDYSEFTAGGLQFKLKPQPYLLANKQNMMQFEEDKLLRVINDQNLDDDAKLVQFNMHLARMVEISLLALANSTDYIKSDDQVITNTDFIIEYYQNCDAATVKTVRENIDKINEQANYTRVDVKCESCDHAYKVNMTFDYASFFAQSS